MNLKRNRSISTNYAEIMPKTKTFENWRHQESIKESKVTEIEEEVDFQDLQEFCNVYLEEVQKVM